MSTFEPSSYQRAVFENVESGKGHLVVVARAGSGKTTTIVEALKRVPAGASTLFVAFNAKIAEELKKRAPWSAEVSTLHSFGFAALRRAMGNVRLDKNRVADLIRDRVQDAADRKTMVRAVGLAKGALASTKQEIERAIATADLDVSAALAPRLADGVRWCMDIAIEEPDVIDYDDMIWLPLALDIKVRQFDRVFVDEVQDLNPAQIELALRACKPDGRICAVGDDRQAIYGFRGADSRAVGNIIGRLDAATLPLSVCYRCARSIVEVAQEVVPSIEAAPTAAEGTVRDATVGEMVKEARGGDFILSRTNAPLVALFFRLIAAEKPAKIAGRDVGAKLTERIQRARATTVVQLLAKTAKWLDGERTKLARLDPPGDPSMVEDIAECISVVSDGATTVAEVEQRLATMFSDDLADDQIVVLSSTHRAKGLERERAFVLVETYRKRPGLAEDNLWYVAVTRAKEELVMVHGKVRE
jgi:DNA helicase-2/ATP-dependent DNA helicase PcrA